MGPNVSSRPFSSPASVAPTTLSPSPRISGAAATSAGDRAACSNAFRVRRDELEGGLLKGIQRELLAPDFLAELKKRVMEAGVSDELGAHLRSWKCDRPEYATLSLDGRTLARGLLTDIGSSLPDLDWLKDVHRNTIRGISV